MNIRELSEADEPYWEELVKTSPSGGFMQSWAWSAFRLAIGETVNRLGLFENERLLGGAMVYSTSQPYSPLESPHGPVLPWADGAVAEEGSGLLLERLREMASVSGIPYARFEPLLESEFPACLKGFEAAPRGFHPNPTRLVSLSGDDEAMLGRMTQKGRYNVRLALKKGVRAARANSEGLRAFESLLDLTAARNGVVGETRWFLERLLGALERRGLGRLYFADFRGMPIAGALVVFYGGRATCLLAASSRLSAPAMASYALHWRIMRDARDAGCLEYDLYGIAPEGEVAGAFSACTLFKSRFGGRTVLYCGARDLYFRPSRDFARAGAPGGRPADV